MPPMIDLYTWSTPNGWKVSIALEEMGLDYEVHPINIGKGDQFEPEFLAISPNNRIPAIVDRETGYSIFESGAILQYLARKTGRFYGEGEAGRIEVEKWLMWQMGGLGPMAGQAHHFLKYAPAMEPPNDLPYAKDRYRNEVKRLYGVLDKQLSKNEFVAGPYSIADMAIWPWANLWEGQQQEIENFPHMKAWLDKVWQRGAVQRGKAVLDETRSDGFDKEAQGHLFKSK
ncbi:glutathione S-transferase family protein [Paracoccaceae bacterium GXU_MW_L88]